MNTISSDLLGQRTQRIEHLQKLRELGINPYPARAKKDYPNADIKNKYVEFEGKTVTLTGRLMAKREHGKLIFGDIQDQSDTIQICIKKDQIETNLKESLLGWAEMKLIDQGDFIQVTGEITRTQQGEITLFVKHFVLLAKSIRPLPVQIDDKEQQFRRRYIDLTLNDQSKKLFERKAKFWEVNRKFMQQAGFMEVETPVLEHVTGGADATPFTTHHNALDQDFFLRISTELYQKRLIGGGFEKIYTIGPNFRNEGLSDEHLQEFYQIEWYWAYADYRDNMNLVKEIFRTIAKEVYGKTKFETRGHSFDLADEWEEISYPDIIKKRFHIDIFEDPDEKMSQALKEHGLELSGAVNRNRLIDNLWKLIRKEVSGPAFLINEPKFMSPLAKSKPDDDRLTERFHVLIAGSELGNGYTEINDPMDQLDRFLDQQKMRDEGDTEAQMLDIDYVEMLEYGMPPTSGYAHSERLFWFLENVTAREGTLFPQMRTEYEDTTKKIYKGLVEFPEKKQTILTDEKRINLSTISTSNKVTIHNDVKERFPGIKTGYVILENIKVEKSNDEIDLLKKLVSKSVKNRYESKSDIKNSERLEGYRRIYKDSGVDPRSRLNSSEAIIRRIVDGKGLYNINNVVDLYNITSAELEIAMAAYDLDKVSGNIELRFGTNQDSITKIGEDHPTQVENGELVYADDEGVICLDFNYRDSDRTKITPQAHKIIVFADGNAEITTSEIEDALSILGGRLERFTGGTVTAWGIVST